MFNTTQIWRHTRSGLTYIVDVDRHGTPVDANGPVDAGLYREAIAFTDLSLLADFDVDLPEEALATPSTPVASAVNVRGITRGERSNLRRKEVARETAAELDRDAAGRFLPSSDDNGTRLTDRGFDNGGGNTVIDTTPTRDRTARRRAASTPTNEAAIVDADPNPSLDVTPTLSDGIIVEKND